MVQAGTQHGMGRGLGIGGAQAGYRCGGLPWGSRQANVGRSQRPLKGRGREPRIPQWEKGHLSPPPPLPAPHTTPGRPILSFGQVMECSSLNSSGLGASVLPTPWGARWMLGTHGLKPGSGASLSFDQLPSPLLWACSKHGP